MDGWTDDGLDRPGGEGGGQTQAQVQVQEKVYTRAIAVTNNMALCQH
jgi:hypothetical protein